ncbi:MAG: 3-phosphoshikimate 1-carboxyvinyltransferase [Longimicrobiales bacterium]|nr:3-phosphoshikimate 1-carboxyvinyltransferase [Longimicrobiales bacterium]
MRIRVPGDKSLTQRALILAALADGDSAISGLLSGGDAASTAAALRMLGVSVGPLPADGRTVLIRGVGLQGLATPTAPLDLGNSGTGTRLLMGALAGSAITAVLTGDASLRGRPMSRVAEPLERMGATVRHLDQAGRLPLQISGARPLSPVEWSPPVASAQVKSALLLAGITGHAAVLLNEPRQSRDHTERLLALMGVPLVEHAGAAGWRVELREPPERLEPLECRIPGDPSSAAFFVALAVLGGAGFHLEMEGVGLNPTRTSFFDLVRRMGGPVETEADAGPPGAEPVGTVLARRGDLVGVSVGADEVPGLIDELPLLAILGTRAQGETRISGAGELRHKESDRIAVMVENLRAVGAEAEELPDGLVVVGSDRPLRGKVRTHGDHRIAMAFGVLGALAENRISLDDPEAADVSFPGFWPLLRSVRESKG